MKTFIAEVSKLVQFESEKKTNNFVEQQAWIQAAHGKPLHVIPVTRDFQTCNGDFQSVLSSPNQHERHPASPNESVKTDDSEEKVV